MRLIPRCWGLLLVLVVASACRFPGTSPLQTFRSINSFAYDLSFSPDGQLLAAGTLRDGAHVWRVQDTALLYTLGAGDIRTIAFSPDGQFLGTGGGGEQGTVTIWSLTDGTLVQTLDATRTAWVSSIAFSPDGALLAVGTHTHVDVFTVADGVRHHTFTISGMQVRFSPDGTQLAIAENLPVIRIYDRPSYRPRAQLPGHGSSIAYAADGTLFAAPGWNNQGMVTLQGAETYPTTVGGENEVQVWSSDNGRHLRAMNTHAGQIHSLAFSPTAQFLVSGSNDGTIRIARVTDGVELDRTTIKHGIDSIAISPDGATVAIGTYQMIYLWPIRDVVQSVGQ